MSQDTIPSPAFDFHKNPKGGVQFTEKPEIIIFQFRSKYHYAMLSFFRKKSESDVVTKVGAVRSVVVGADVS